MKRILLLFFFFSNFFAASAQNWEELDKAIVQLSEQGKYQEAVSFAVKAMNLARAENGDSSLRYSISSCRFAYLHTKLGNTAVADATYNKAIVRLGKLLTNSFSSGNYTLAESVCKETLIQIQKIKGENHPDYLASLNNLAEIYRVSQKYEASESIQKNVITRAKNAYGENHAVYATTLDNLAALYLNTGNYSSAEPLFKQSMEIRKKLLGKEHPDYAATVNNLGELYRHMGNYETAEPLLLEALSINKKTNGENHPHYISSLNNLAVLYDAMGKLKESEQLYKESTKKRLESLGPQHPDYATSLNNLALYYKRTGDYTTALDLFAQSLEISRNAFGNKHPIYADCLNNLAAVASLIGMDTTAEKFLKNALRIYEDKLGKKSPEYAGTLVNLALLNSSTHKFKAAEEQFNNGISLVLQSILENFHTLSEKEKMIWLKTREGNFEAAFSLLSKEKDPTPEYLQQSVTHQLQLKGLVLNDGIKILELVRSQGDSALLQLLSQWQNNKKLLSKQYSQPVENRIRGIDSLENISNEMEKQINQRSSVFRSSQKDMQAGFKEVQEQLKADEAAIEFIRFDYHNKKWTDSILYGAFIIRKNDPAPKFVTICEEKQLLRLFDSAGNSATTMVSSFYRGLGLKNKNASTLGTELYNLVWAPLEKYLAGIKKIVYSPAGKLYSIAFHALPVDSATVLMDRYQLQQHTSTRQVAFRVKVEQNVKPTAISLFGDATFTMDSLQLLKQKKNTVGNQASSIYSPQKRGSDKNAWSKLPGTGLEVSKIKQLFEANKIMSNSFIGVSASEESLKDLSGRSPQILHIATHGFFLPEPVKKRNDIDHEQTNSYTMADDPLLRSGLILAGANYAWSGNRPVDGVEDGIATAYEISQLNLSNTDLVVLSACETALGEIKGSEGVFGLQRAFKMAGVKKMIVSLWQVPDKETAELMVAFYSYWMKGKSINEAFAQAQADMRKKYQPFYWAAFVLVE